MIHYKIARQGVAPSTRSKSFTRKVWYEVVESFIDDNGNPVEFTMNDVLRALRVFDAESRIWRRLDPKRTQQAYDHLSRWASRGLFVTRRSYVYEGATLESIEADGNS